MAYNPESVVGDPVAPCEEGMDLMKRVLIVAMAACLTASAAQAQAPAPTDQEMIERSVLAAPPNARAAAMVVKWNPDGTRVTLRPGTNNLVCWDQSVWPHQRPFSAHCTSVANLPRVEQNREFYMKAPNAKEAEALVQAAEKAGMRKVPEFGAGNYGLVGNDQATARGHVTIAVPYATTESLKLSSKPIASGAWIMDAGTSGAHIMVPGH
jgi:hypothetical protein